MNARAIEDEKASVPEGFVQPPPPGNEVVPGGTRRGKMIATIETRPDYILDHEKEPSQAKSNGVGEVARIAIKAKGRVLFVDPIDVFVAKAQGNYIALVHKSGSYLVRETMATAEQKLTALGFLRIHRSVLVNTNLVKDLRRDNTGTYVLRTTDGSEYPVGRAYKENLKMIARSWLGVELV